MQQLLDFLSRLSREGIFFRLGTARPEAIMVEIAIPGERWEVEYFADGHVVVERFKGDGILGDETLLEELWAHHAKDLGHDSGAG